MHLPETSTPSTKTRHKKSGVATYVVRTLHTYAKRMLWRIQQALGMRARTDSTHIPDLNPVDRFYGEEAARIAPYLDRLDEMLRNRESSIREIAITGPFSSGKTSIVLTYQRQHPELRFVHISLGAFYQQLKLNDTEQTPQKAPLADIEKSILQQLFYRADSDRMPLSRFQRISMKRNRRRYSYVFAVWITALGLMYLPDTANSHWHIGPLLAQAARDYSLTNPAIWLLSALLAPVILFIKDAFAFLKPLTITKLNPLKADLELSSVSQDQASVFNKYLEEILYFFSVTRTDVVVFEDLDRFGQPDIFVKLKELNGLINDSAALSSTPVRFLYALQDDVFCGEQRTKFFDAIIPVMPIAHSSNSYPQLKALLADSELDAGIEDMLLREVSLYLSDLRLIKNIVSEYALYKKILQTNQDKLPLSPLFALMVYKNIFADDFALLHLGQGVLASAVVDVAALKHTIEHSSDYKKARQKQDEACYKTCEKTQCKQRCEQRPRLDLLPLRDLCLQYPHIVFAQFGPQHALLKLLLRGGYIDQHYYRYISHFREGVMTNNDRVLIDAVKQRTAHDVHYSLDDPALVSSFFSLDDMQHISIVNLDLIDHWLSHDNALAIDGIVAIIRANDDCFKWIFLCSEHLKQQHLWHQALIRRWPDVIEAATSRIVVESEQKAFALKMLYACAAPEYWGLLDNNQTFLGRYLSEHSHYSAELFTQSQTPSKTYSLQSEHIIGLLQHLQVRIKSLQTVADHAAFLHALITHDLLLISAANLAVLAAHYLPASNTSDTSDTSDNEQRVNSAALLDFTQLAHASNAHFAEFIQRHVAPLSDLLIHQEIYVSDYHDVLDLLNHDNITPALRQQLITQVAFKIPKLDNAVVPEDTLAACTRAKKVAYHWDNLLHMLAHDQLEDADIARYLLQAQNTLLNRPAPHLKQLLSRLERVLWLDMIDTSTCLTYLKHIEIAFEADELGNIPSHKLSAMVNDHCIEARLDNYQALLHIDKSLAHQLVVQYYADDPGHLNLMRGIQPSQTLFYFLLDSDGVDKAQKRQLIREFHALIDTDHPNRALIALVSTDKLGATYREDPDIPALMSKQVEDLLQHHQELYTRQALFLGQLQYLEPNTARALLHYVSGDLADIFDGQSHHYVSANAENRILVDALKQRRLIYDYDVIRAKSSQISDQLAIYVKSAAVV